MRPRVAAACGGKGDRNAKKELIKDHLHHCVEGTAEAMPREVRGLIKEFQGVTKYL
jgi:DNA-binding FrmR family transcriptional regulator